MDKFLFSTDFVILDMAKDLETHLFLGRPFLALGRAPNDVEMGGLMTRFNDERVLFNIFDAMC